MKKLFYILSAIFLLSCLTIHAQTLEEILAKHFQTIGQDKLSEVQSLITKGKMQQSGIEILFIQYVKRPNKMRSEATIQGLTSITAYNGKQSWQLNPMLGDTLPQPATKEVTDELKEGADLDGMLYNYKEKGYTLELTGTDDFDGQKVFLLKLTKPNGNVYIHYMDADNFVILKTVSKIKIKGVEREAEMVYSNYKPVEGIIFPFSSEIKVAGNTVGQMVIDSVIINQDIDDSIFEISSVTKQKKD